MSGSAVAAISGLAVVGVGIVVLIVLYNGLVRARVRVREAWSGIDVQLRRRADLAPNLVESVRGYAAHERGVLEDVVQARTALHQAGGVSQAAGANTMLTQTLGRLFAVAEAYPALRASENFALLQEELSDTETKIAYARQFYNRNVLDLNTRIETFPSVIVAGLFGLTPGEFFEAAARERALPVVSFLPAAAEERSA